MGVFILTFSSIFKNKKIIILFFSLIAFDIFLWFITSEHFDCFYYHGGWAHYIRENGVFNIYNENSMRYMDYDYPPIVSFLIAPFAVPIDNLYKIIFSQLPTKPIYSNVWIPFCSLIKIPFIIPNIVFVVYVYKKISKTFALMWFINPVIVIDLFLYGQSDSLLCICLFFMLFYFKEKKYYSATIWFAIGCLTKLQMVYLAPIFLILLLKSKSIKKILTCIGLGAMIGLAVFLPFMICSGNPLLPFDVYLGGFGKYPVLTFCSNVWWPFCNLNYSNIQTIDQLPFGSVINIGLYLIIIIFFCYKIIKKENFLPYVCMYLFSIFEFCLLQHERYIVPAMVPLLIMLYIDKEKSKKLARATYMLIITSATHIFSHIVYNFDTTLFKTFFSFVDFICVFLFIISFIMLARAIKQIDTEERRDREAIAEGNAS